MPGHFKNEVRKRHSLCANRLRLGRERTAQTNRSRHVCYEGPAASVPASKPRLVPVMTTILPDMFSFMAFLRVELRYSGIARP